MAVQKKVVPPLLKWRAKNYENTHTTGYLLPPLPKRKQSKSSPKYLRKWLPPITKMTTSQPLITAQFPLTEFTALRPSSRGVIFSPRRSSSTGRPPRGQRNSLPPSLNSSFSGGRPSTLSHKSHGSTVMLMANPKLTSIEVESIIRQKVGESIDQLRRAFSVYDSERTASVTKGEFRRVLENYCLPLSTEQFNCLLVKIGSNPNGTISYQKFLDRFNGKSALTHALLSKSNTAIGFGRGEVNELKLQKFTVSDNSQEIGIDSVERTLQHKIASNLRHVVKAFQLFDYNRDGHVQRHELRRVLESWCMKISDAHFDKLWSRYDQQHVGTIDYREFLRKLGVNAASAEKQVLSKSNVDMDGDATDAPWDAKKKRLEREKDVTDLVLKRNKNKNLKKSRKYEGAGFAVLEKEFRQKMVTNFENIKRAMKTFDLNNDGFIAIEDLKAVIDNFVVLTNDEAFQQLMYKFEVRGTGKISWEQFLGKFQDPQSNGNGQTIPIGQNHKVNPTRQAIEAASPSELVSKLKKHVVNNFASLKQAFLAFDEKRKGEITRADLRRIVEAFTLKLTEENFKDLMIYLDPQHTGYIRYHNFLDLFETKESVSAHKWLYSTHKFNEKQAPAILAWETVEEILRVKLSENYKMVADEYVALDTVEDGTINKTNLRRLLDRYALTTSEEHFKKLWGSCKEREKGRIDFSEFLCNLGIDVQPGDLEGPSTRIYDESNVRESRRRNDQEERIGEIEKIDQRHTNSLTAHEVVVKLKDRMAQHDCAIRKTFLRYSRSGRGRVTKRDLRKMLEDMGFRMESSQFNEFTEKLKFKGRGLDYSDFVAGFQDLRTDGMAQELQRKGNHTVNPTNVKYMTAKECFGSLLDRMRQNFGSVRSAFYKVDDDHDGILTMNEFRRLLDNFMFIITDETFHELLKMLKLTKESALSYHDFLEKFEVVDREEGHPWLTSEHRFNQVRSASDLMADQVHKCLVYKAAQAWSDLAKAFQNFDVDGNGIITKKELRSVLYRFILPMNPNEFEKLWSRYDQEGKGFISHQDFLSKLGVGFAPGDNKGLQGTSRKMLDENYENVLAHHELQQAKHDEISKNQIKYSKHLSAETVERELKDRFREYYSDFDKAFRKLDRNKDGFVTLNDLQRILVQLNYFLDDEQFKALLTRLGLPYNRAKLSYFDFLRAIDDGRASKFGRRRSIGREKVTWSQSQEHLPIEKAVAKLKDKITVNYDSLNSAFRAFDRGQTGLVRVSDFRRLLDNFCFCLSDKQFRAVLVKCRITGDGSVTSNKNINWVVFLQDFSLIKDVKLKEWTDYVGKAAPPQTPQELSQAQVEDRVTDVVTARFQAVSNAFVEADYAKIFVVSKEDFREIFHEHIMRLTNDQFDRLWNKQAVNEFNNLEYREFLKRYNKPQQQIENNNKDIPDNTVNTSLPLEVTARPLLSRPSTADSFRLPQKFKSRPSTPLVCAEGAESKLKVMVFRNWQDIQKECKKLDRDGSGTILPDEFVGILDHFGVMLSLEDARQLMVKYELGDQSGRFSYRDFLRHFILTLKPQEDGLLKRRKLHAAKLPVDTGKESTNFIEAMVALRERIINCWKEMRRHFRMADPKAQGFVSPTVFRQILRQFAINLNEEDFFHLLSFYDPKMKGQISYNDFIRAFLQ